jgi:uncharacterized protein YlaI
MRRLTTAPNLAIATLWADMLKQGGFDASVQRAYASSIAGEMPPDQCLPEVWVMDDSTHAEAAALLAQLRNAPYRHWVCPGCREQIEGPFDQCWSCGAAMPP